MFLISIINSGVMMEDNPFFDSLEESTDTRTGDTCARCSSSEVYGNYDKLSWYDGTAEDLKERECFSCGFVWKCNL